MRYVDEYRDEAQARKMAELIARTVRRPWTVMEICGGQTHTLLRCGIDQMLPEAVTLVHGPGCPVCVTPLEMIDRAIAIAQRPGSKLDLLSVKARGGDVRMLYSPLDAVKLAAAHPDREVVFFAVGFETTAPANAMAVREARRRGLANFSILASHVLVPPAMEAILSSPVNRVQGFLAAGHVCTVMGFHEYVLAALEEGRHGVENQYTRSVTREGNLPAQAVLAEVFEVCDRPWRGIGVIPRSGTRLRDAYAAHDAERKFDVGSITAQEPSVCIAGEILQGLKKPSACSAFGKECTPEHPLGAPMVSSEGACSAYYQYHRT
jgi:hydrogenase expression/formation protein HypD